MTAPASRDFDIIVFGATGFTGQLVADYLANHAQPLKWALAGRSASKLEAVRAALPARARATPIVVADALDAAAMAALAKRTRVVCTTAGPFAMYGSELVAACVAAGTHYCDLTGEVQWMRRMIDAHHEHARSTGARIVHTCGFDSIPSDLGTWALQQEFLARFGRPASSVTALYGATKGGLSGGTIASALHTADELAADPALRRVLGNPYGLDPDPRAERPPAPDAYGIGYDKRLHVFTAPFVMAMVNSRVVRRAHALAGFPWGADFRYDERMSAPGNAGGLVRASVTTAALGAFALVASQPKLRALVERRLPKPGDGPTAEQRTSGYWKLELVGQAGDDRLVYTASDRADPGYGSTAKMLGESALCLAFDPLSSPGGVQTPSVAMAAPLLDRLRAAGLTFAPA